MMTVAPSVTYSPPVWQRRLSVHTLLSQVLPVMDTLQRQSASGQTSSAHTWGAAACYTVILQMRCCQYCHRQDCLAEGILMVRS